VDVVIGEEVSTLNGHLLALYLQERVPPGMPADLTIELVHAQGGLAVAAHPFHPIRYRHPGRPALASLIPHLRSTASRSSTTPGSPPASTTPGRPCAMPSGCWRSPAAVTPTTLRTWAAPSHPSRGGTGLPSGEPSWSGEREPISHGPGP
jgi:hypothetical protein